MCTVQKLFVQSITALSQDEENHEAELTSGNETGSTMDYEEAQNIEVETISIPQESPNKAGDERTVALGDCTIITSIAQDNGTHRAVVHWSADGVGKVEEVKTVSEIGNKLQTRNTDAAVIQLGAQPNAPSERANVNGEAEKVLAVSASAKGIAEPAASESTASGPTIVEIVEGSSGEDEAIVMELSDMNLDRNSGGDVTETEESRLAGFAVTPASHPKQSFMLETEAGCSFTDVITIDSDCGSADEVDVANDDGMGNATVIVQLLSSGARLEEIGESAVQSIPYSEFMTADSDVLPDLKRPSRKRKSQRKKKGKEKKKKKRKKSHKAEKEKKTKSDRGSKKVSKKERRSLQKKKKRPTLKAEIIKGGSVRGHDKLFDEEGYSYTLKKAGRKHFCDLWRCSYRNNKLRCNAIISQAPGGKFWRGLRTHNHLPRENSRTATVVIKDAKKMCEKCPEKSPYAIVKEVLKKYLGEEDAKDFDPRAIYNFATSVRSYRRRIGMSNGILGMKRKRPLSEIEQKEMEERKKAVAANPPITRWNCGKAQIIDPSTLEFVPGASERGNGKLFDAEGYSYNMCRVYQSEKKLWKCSTRNRNWWCPAAIHQYPDGTYRKRAREHNHPPKENAKLVAVITAEGKQKSLENPGVPPNTVVDNTIERHYGAAAKDFDYQAKLSIRRTVAHFQKKEGIFQEKIDHKPTVESQIIDPSTLRIMRGASLRGADKMFCDDGHSFTFKRRNVCGSCLWRCSVRQDSNKCSATVKQSADGIFTTGLRPHNHPPQAQSQLKAIVAAKARMEVTLNPKTPVRELVKETLRKHSDDVAAGGGDLTQLTEYLSYNMHYHRRKMAVEPDAFNFKLEKACLPTEFLKKDVSLPDARFLIFALGEQLEWLQKADVWYFQMTEKIVKKPFTQLLSIHTFMKSEKCVKQLPILFCFMSRTRKSDYVALLNQILEMLPVAPGVERVVAGFDKNLWKALKCTLTGVEIRGCAHLYREAVLKHIKDLGFKKYLSKDEEISKILKKLLVLCLLPPGQISSTFKKLEKSSVAPKSLVEIVNKRWIKHKTWRPAAWSVFNCPFRLEEEANVWLDKLGKGDQKTKHGFYPLLQILHNSSVATFLDTKIKVVTNKKLRKHQKKSTGVQGKVFHHWEQYTEGKRSAHKLVQSCIKAYS